MMFPESQLVSVCRVVSASGSPLAPWAFSTNPRENGLRYRLKFFFELSYVVNETQEMEKPLVKIGSKRMFVSRYLERVGCLQSSSSLVLD